LWGDRGGGAIAAPIVTSEAPMPLVSNRPSMASASDMPECFDLLILRITLSETVAQTRVGCSAREGLSGVKAEEVRKTKPTVKCVT
jgi:hypothetical protein